MASTRTASRPAYKNLLLVGGVLFIALGIGNWAVGEVQSRPFAEYIRQHPGPKPDSDGLKAALLEPPDHAREQRNVSRAKLEFYQLVQSGGRLMVVVGSLGVLAALIDLTGLARRPR